MPKHCCDMMDKSTTLDCDQHNDTFECADVLIYYSAKFDEYGIIIHDGGTSYSEIKFCPYCGTTLPQSKRDLWFETLAKLGFDDPFDQDIPEDFESDLWYKK